MEGSTGRTWDSVCGECSRFDCGRCTAYGRDVEAKDGFAAICDCFAPLDEALAAAQ